VHNDKQAEQLLKANLIGSNPIEVERHSSLDSSREDVSTDALDGMSATRFNLLSDQSVSRACRLSGNRGGKPFPRITIFQTFEVPSLPSRIIYWARKGFCTAVYPKRDARSLGTHKGGALLTLSVGAAVKQLRNTRIQRQKPSFPGRKGNSGTPGQGLFIVLDTHKKFLTNKPKTGDLVIYISSSLPTRS
jgi:hypothetical protein